MAQGGLSALKESRVRLAVTLPCSAEALPANTIKILRTQSQGLVPGSCCLGPRWQVRGARDCRPHVALSWAVLCCRPLCLGGAPSRVAKATTGIVHNCWEWDFSISVWERKLISEYLGLLCNLELDKCIHCRGCSFWIPTGRPVALMTAEPPVFRILARDLTPVWRQK